MSVARRQLAWQARMGSTRIREGGKKAAVTCWGDFTTARLVPIKLTFFLLMGATQCLSPYSTVFARALGLTLKETAVIVSIAPLIPLLAPTLAGVMADKIGNFKLFLMVTVAISGCIPLFMMAIPPARDISTVSSTDSRPENVTFDLLCSSDHFYLRKMDGLGSGGPASPACQFLNSTVTVENMRARDCGYECKSPVIHYPDELHAVFRDNGINIVIKHSDTDEFLCTVNEADNRLPQKCYRTKWNDTWFEAEDPQSFILDKVSIDLEKFYYKRLLDLGGKYKMSPNDQLIFGCGYGYFSAGVNLTAIQFGSTGLGASDDSAGATITDDYPSELTARKVWKKPSDTARPSHSWCRFHCQVDIPHETICTDPSTVDDPNGDEQDAKVRLTVGLYVAIKICSSFFTGMTYTLFEVATIAVLKHHGNDYGMQRLYGSIGGMIFAPLAGWLVDFSSGGSNTYKGYYVTFVLYCLIKLVCSLIIRKLNLKFKLPARNLWQNVFKLLVTLEVLLLLVAVMISGICYGFIENFQPWLLRDLGADNWFIGLTTTVASLAALPFLAISDSVCAKFGHIQSISFGLVCYAIRCIGYSVLQAPYWCVPLEVLEGATTGLLIAATILYAAKLAPRSSQATLQGVIATVHYGIGKSIGSFLGGYLMSELGAPVAFRIFSGIAFGVAFGYYLVFKIVLLPRQQKLEVLKQQVCNMPIKTLTLKQHRRHSMRYDKNVIIEGIEGGCDPKQNPSQMPVRESHALKQPDTDIDNNPAYRHQHEQTDTNNRKNDTDDTVIHQSEEETIQEPLSSFPTWSDDEPDEANYSLYPTLLHGSTPTASTPYKPNSRNPKPPSGLNCTEVSAVQPQTSDETSSFR